ncbi:transposase [Actinospica acidiphila]|uniref:Transposase n=1 Tax=Actinospica acidiphila TaxID=304899 RepID=A0A9X5CPP6_9ACTN|nr:transposase [Actinospica acidiphila]
MRRTALPRRSVVEGCSNRLKDSRGIANRYDKTAVSCEAAVTLASLLLWAGSARRRTPAAGSAVRSGSGDVHRASARPPGRRSPRAVVAALQVLRVSARRGPAPMW